MTNDIEPIEIMVIRRKNVVISKVENSFKMLGINDIHLHVHIITSIDSISRTILQILDILINLSCQCLKLL